MDKKKEKNVPSKKKDRLKFLEEEYVGKEIQEGENFKYSPLDKDPITKEILPGRYHKVTLEDFKSIVEADPTFNKQYVQWLLNIYVKGNLLLEDLSKATQDLTTLYKFKSKISEQERDVTQFRNINELYDAVKRISSMKEEDLLSKTQLQKKIKREGVEVHLENDRWLVLTPLTKEASILYGSNTRWCTASALNSHYESYMNAGKLYIIINKQVPESDKKNHKIQFHFERGHFMDAEDVTINWKDLLKKNSDLLDCFTRLKDGNGLRLKLMFNMNLEPEDKIIKTGSNLQWLREFEGDELPDGLEIYGDFDLSNCRATKIRNLIVHGDLNIRNSQITRIEGFLKVYGTFDAENSNLEYLPDGTYVKGTLRVKDSKLVRLPKKLTIGGHLFASNIPLKEIPSDMEVTENLYIKGTGISEMDLPDSVKVGGRIFTKSQPII